MNLLTLANGITLAWCRLDGETGHAAGRRLLAGLYRSTAGADLPPIALGHRGKPYFVDSPWHFSISHTRGHAFCGIARFPIGVDSEECSRRVRPGLAEKILSPGEKARYQAAADPQKALLTLWVLKEAAGKLTGEGINGCPDHTDFSLDDPRVMTIDGCLVAVVKEEHHAF